jgi:hypothetical protein
VKGLAGRAGAVGLVVLSLGVAAVTASASLKDVLRYRRLRKM